MNIDDRDDMMRDLMAMNDADLSDETPPFSEKVEDVFIDPVQAVKDKSEMIKIGTKEFYFDLGEPIFFRAEATNNTKAATICRICDGPTKTALI